MLCVSLCCSRCEFSFLKTDISNKELVINGNISSQNNLFVLKLRIQVNIHCYNNDVCATEVAVICCL